MSDRPLSLVAPFVDGLASGLRGRMSAASEFGASLDDIVAAAQRAWPGFTVPPEAFAAYLAARVPAEAEDVALALGELRANDLYLACACAMGERRAIGAFESRYAGDVDAVLVRILGSTDRRDEVMQLVRHHLFVGKDGAPPLMARYAGRSSLRTWLNSTLVRLVLNFATRTEKEVPVEDGILAALPATGSDPELEHFKRVYAAEFRTALQEAILGLGARERNLLRYGFADGLTIDQIGALYGVHRASAARWINAARRKLLVRLRGALMQKLRVDQQEFESIVRLIQSRIDVSLRRCFREAEGGDP